MRLLMSYAVAVLLLFYIVPTYAACDGRDLMPEWRQKYPEAVARMEAKVARMPFSEGKLFRVTKEGRGPSFVLGSIHTYDPRFIPLSPRIFSVLQNTQTVALELDSQDFDIEKIFLNNAAQIALQVFAQAGERPLDFLTVEEKAILSNAVGKIGLPTSSALTTRPTLLSMALPLMICGELEKNGVDNEVERLARASGKQVVGLETFLEQLISLNDIPFEMQKDILRQSLRNLSEAGNGIKTVTNLYASGQTGVVVALIQSPEKEFGDYWGTPELFVKKILDDRNIRMRDRAAPLLEKGGAFIVVGAAHLPGENGLLKLIENEGFHVEGIE